MLDPRITKLAELLCSHSCDLSASDGVLIHAFDIPEEAVAEIVRCAQAKGAKVAVRLESNLVKRQLMHGLTLETAQLIAKVEKYEMEQMTAYIALRGTNNYAELSEVPGDKMSLWSKEYTTPVVFGVRVPKTKWVALRWPT